MESPRCKIFRMASLLSESKNIIDVMARERSELLSRVESLRVDRQTIDTSTETADLPLPILFDGSQKKKKEKEEEEEEEEVKEEKKKSSLSATTTNENNSNLESNGVRNDRSKLIDEAERMLVEALTASEMGGGGRSAVAVNSESAEPGVSRRKAKRAGKHLSKLLDILEPRAKSSGGGNRKKTDVRARLKKQFKELERLRKRQEEQDEELEQQRRFFRELRGASQYKETAKESGKVDKDSTDRADSNDSESQTDDDDEDECDHVTVYKGEDEESREKITMERVRLPNPKLVKKNLIRLHADNLKRLVKSRPSGKTSVDANNNSSSAAAGDPNRPKSKPTGGNVHGRSVHFEKSDEGNESACDSRRTSSPAVSKASKSGGRGRNSTGSSKFDDENDDDDDDNASSGTFDEGEPKRSRGRKGRRRRGGGGGGGGGEQDLADARGSLTRRAEDRSGAESRAGRRSRDTNNSAIRPEPARGTRNSRSRRSKKEKRRRGNDGPDSNSSRSSSEVSSCRDSGSCGEAAQDSDDVERFLLRQVKKEQEILEKEILQHRIELDREKKKLMDFMQESQKNRKNVSEEIQKYLSELEGTIMEKERDVSDENDVSEVKTGDKTDQSPAETRHAKNASDAKKSSGVRSDKKSLRSKRSEVTTGMSNAGQEKKSKKSSDDGLSSIVSFGYPLNTPNPAGKHSRFRALNDGGGAGSKLSYGSVPSHPPPDENSTALLDSLALLEIGRSPSSKSRKKNSSFSIWGC